MILYLGSSIVALLLLFFAWKFPRLCRALFFLLFAWASYTNFNAAIRTPHFYLSYQDTTFLNGYRVFINGWFSQHVTAVVCMIAACQAGIGISMLMKDTIFKMGLIGGFIFLIAIAPLGIGAAFPCTLIMAASLWLLSRNSNRYLWLRPDA